MTTADALIAELRRTRAPQGHVHLNNAGVAPMAHVARDAAVRVVERMVEGSAGVGALLAEYERARAVFGALVGVPADQVSFFQTCAAAISQVALGLSLEAGAEIVLPDQEYPSNAYPWHRAAERVGGRVVLVPSDPDLALHVDRIIGAITERTRVVALSWVQFQSGATVDLAPIAAAAHAQGAWLVVDAIQGLGVRPFDLAALGVDAVCGGTHKWLMGPLGHGFLALAPGRRAELAPLVHGAMTYGTPDDAVDSRATPRDDPRRFEPGAPLLVGAIAGAASIALMHEIGLARIATENQVLRKLVVEHARARGFSVLQPTHVDSAIVTMRLPGDGRGARAAAHVAALRQAGISVAARGGGIRVAPHIHNTPEDVERLFTALDALAHGGVTGGSP